MVIFTEYFIIFIFQEGAGLETLCSAVRELIHSCGDELGWCFTEDQVDLGWCLDGAWMSSDELGCCLDEHG